MTAVTLACPLCAGNIQVDSALAGQQVACPLCHGALLLPPAEVLAQFAPPQPAYQPPQEQLFSLTCPACVNALQVTAAMSGQQVACPFCSSPIMVPLLQGPAPQQWNAPPEPAQAPAPAPPPEELPSPAPDDFDVSSLLPPGAELSEAPAAPKPVPQKQPEPSPADRLPPTRSPARPKAEEAPAAPPSADRFPPGHSARQTTSPPATDRFPPGFGGSKASEAKERVEKAKEGPRRDERLPPPRNEQEVVEKQIDSPPTIPEPAIEDLLPPGALPPSALPPSDLPQSNEVATVPQPTATVPSPSSLAPAPSPVDHLLPPGAAEVNTPAVGRPTALQPTSLADTLLPPGADGSPAGNSPAAEVPLPKTQAGPLRPVLAPGQPPPAQGIDALQVKGREKEAAEAEQEIKKLSAQEKARRRFRRNAIMWSICVVILFAVFYFMSR